MAGMKNVISGMGVPTSVNDMSVEEVRSLFDSKKHIEELYSTVRRETMARVVNDMAITKDRYTAREIADKTGLSPISVAQSLVRTPRVSRTTRIVRRTYAEIVDGNINYDNIFTLTQEVNEYYCAR